MALSLAQVLFVEDQKMVAGLIQLELEQANIHVTSVPTGEQCLTLARERKFDLILLDQMLPEMDGLEVCRHLKRDPALQEIPVIFFTAYPSRSYEDEARRLGAVDYLIKGFPEPRLAARILAEVELARDRTSRSAKEPHPNPNGDAQRPRPEH